MFLPQRNFLPENRISPSPKASSFLLQSRPCIQAVGYNRAYRSFFYYKETFYLKFIHFLDLSIKILPTIWAIEATFALACPIAHAHAFILACCNQEQVIMPRILYMFLPQRKLYLKFIYYLDLKHQFFCNNPGH